MNVRNGHSVFSPNHRLASAGRGGELKHVFPKYVLVFAPHAGLKEQARNHFGIGNNLRRHENLLGGNMPENGRRDLNAKKFLRVYLLYTFASGFAYKV